MQVLLFTLEYPPFFGGVANYYGYLIKYWPEPAGIFVLNNNDNQLINRQWPFLKWLPAIFKLKQAVKKNKIDHIIIGQILPLGLIGLMVSKIFRIKYSVVFHGLDLSFAVKRWRKRIIAKIILSQAQNIICTNRYTAKLTSRLLLKNQPAKITVVNPGVETNSTSQAIISKKIKQRYNLEDKTVLLSVGRLVKRKGFDQVIEALPAVLKKTPNLIYVILGNGEEKDNLQLQISNLKLKDKVLIIDNASNDERDAWYSLSSIFVMLPRNINGDFEGFGIVYLEANLAGKPVLAAKSGGVADAVIDGLNGFLVNGENSPEISDKIIKLASDQELCRKLGRNGLKRAIKEFNWRKQAEEFYKIVK